MSALPASRTCVTMDASAHAFCALPLPPASVFPVVPVVRVIDTPFTGMFEVADTTVEPATADMIVTVQLAVAPPAQVELGDPTQLPAPLTIDAGAQPLPSVPPGAFTRIVITRF